MSWPLVTFVRMGNLATDGETNVSGPFVLGHIYHGPWQVHLYTPPGVKCRRFAQPGPIPIVGIAAFGEHFSVHNRIAEGDDKPVGKGTLSTGIQGESKGVPVNKSVSIRQSSYQGFRWLVHDGTDEQALFRGDHPDFSWELPGFAGGRDGYDHVVKVRRGRPDGLIGFAINRDSGAIVVDSGHADIMDGDTVQHTFDLLLGQLVLIMDMREPRN